MKGSLGRMRWCAGVLRRGGGECENERTKWKINIKWGSFALERILSAPRSSFFSPSRTSSDTNARRSWVSPCPRLLASVSRTRNLLKISAIFSSSLIPLLHFSAFYCAEAFKKKKNFYLLEPTDERESRRNFNLNYNFPHFKSQSKMSLLSVYTARRVQSKSKQDNEMKTGKAKTLF